MCRYFVAQVAVFRFELFPQTLDLLKLFLDLLIHPLAFGHIEGHPHEPTASEPVPRLEPTPGVHPTHLPIGRNDPVFDVGLIPIATGFVNCRADQCPIIDVDLFEKMLKS